MLPQSSQTQQHPAFWLQLPCSTLQTNTPLGVYFVLGVVLFAVPKLRKAVRCLLGKIRATLASSTGLSAMSLKLPKTHIQQGIFQQEHTSKQGHVLIS